MVKMPFTVSLLASWSLVTLAKPELILRFGDMTDAAMLFPLNQGLLDQLNLVFKFESL